MPRRWLHESLDIVVWGESYWQEHKRKDAAYKTLGPKHRAVGHPWYSKFKRDWTFEDPFPPKVLEKTRRIRITKGGAAAEKYQANLTHDYLDRLWDTFDRADRRQVAESIRHLILNTRMLRDWAGVDVADWSSGFRAPSRACSFRSRPGSQLRALHAPTNDSAPTS
jgi:hypothetical protein